MELRRQVEGNEVVFYNAETGKEIKREPLRRGPSVLYIVLNIFGLIIILASFLQAGSLGRHATGTAVLTTIIYGIVAGLVLFAFAKIIRLLEQIADKP